MNNQHFYVGVDIGKTKIACGLFTEELGLVDNATYPSGQCAKDILSIVEKAIAKYFTLYQTYIRGIGIGTFGIVDPQNGVVLSSGTIKEWNMIPLGDYFQQCFHVPVSVENDVKAALYGEAIQGNDANYRSILYLSIGTSIGMAFMKDGFLLRGDHSSFGEISRFLPRNSRYTLEQLIGGRGISLQYYNQTGIQKSCQELMALAVEGDPVAEQIFRQFAISVADLMCWLTMCFDPGCLIIGGGVVCNNPSLFQMIDKQYQVGNNKSVRTLSLAKLGANSGIYGAAALVRLFINGAI